MDDTFSFGFWGKSSEELLHSKFPMHRACRDGDLRVLSELLMSSAEDQYDLFAEDQFYGWTPAHWSAYYGKLECLQKLVLAGISYDVATERFNQTPTHVASFGNQPHCLLWLLQNGTVVNRRDYLGETAMHKAARSGSIECLKLLQSFGAISSVPNNNGHTALDLAVSCGHEQCAEYLQQTMNSVAVHSNGHPLANGLNRVQAGVFEHVNGHTDEFNVDSSMDLQANGQSCFFSRKRTMIDNDENGSKKARTDDITTAVSCGLTAISHVDLPDESMMTESTLKNNIEAMEMEQVPRRKPARWRCQAFVI
ncbi:ankyrin repeat domain-containing protein 10-like isoform X2 [Anneissia japonica]|uniref:ankyrin repeat domain-containing protein 10-like isoform X2 n=1 Tax=Anneissia japonica TaxID=1529436 RepID=UPI0014257637|nr:ankyrin repeat domain-containing protein 10-like isoform X2 [Anneissia japonica]